MIPAFVYTYSPVSSLHQASPTILILLLEQLLVHNLFVLGRNHPQAYPTKVNSCLDNAVIILHPDPLL